MKLKNKPSDYQEKYVKLKKKLQRIIEEEREALNSGLDTNYQKCWSRCIYKFSDVVDKFQKHDDKFHRTIPHEKSDSEED